MSMSRYDVQDPEQIFEELEDSGNWRITDKKPNFIDRNTIARGLVCGQQLPFIYALVAIEKDSIVKLEMRRLLSRIYASVPFEVHDGEGGIDGPHSRTIRNISRGTVYFHAGWQAKVNRAIAEYCNTRFGEN